MARIAEPQLLVLVVRHRSDTEQTGKHEWKDDDVPTSLTTDSKTAIKCRESMKRGSPVYIHRCAWKDQPATISGHVRVKSVNGVHVTFGDGEAAHLAPFHAPDRGTCFYEAPPSKFKPSKA